MGIMRLTDEENVIRDLKTNRQRVVPQATVLYCDSNSIPATLSTNTLLYTTDTRELYIGGKDGIKRVNLGSDGAIIDKSEFLTREDAAILYIQKQNLNPDLVITTDNIGSHIKNLSDTVNEIQAQFTDFYTKNEVFTKDEANKRFIDISEFAQGMSTKVNQQIQTSGGNYSQIINSSAGAQLKFRNISNSEDGVVSVEPTKITLSFTNSKITGPGVEKSGTQFIITKGGAYYYNSADVDSTSSATSLYITDTGYVRLNEIYRVATYRDIVAYEDNVNALIDRLNTVEQTALAALNTANTASDYGRQTYQLAQAAISTSDDAYGMAQEGYSLASGVNSSLATVLDDLETLQDSFTYVQSAADASQQKVNENADSLSLSIQHLGSRLDGFGETLDTILDVPPGTDEPATPTVSVVSANLTSNSELVSYSATVNDIHWPESAICVLNNGETDTFLVNWDKDMFEVNKTGYIQSIIGFLEAKDGIVIPDRLYVTYYVRVCESDNVSTSDDDYLWQDYFVMPANQDTWDHVLMRLGHPLLTEEDMLGTITDNNEYINPVCEIVIMGTAKSTLIVSEPRLLTDIEVRTYLNENLLSVLPNEEDRIVPVDMTDAQIQSIKTSSESKIAYYMTHISTHGQFASNGGFQISTAGALKFGSKSTNTSIIYKVQYKNLG